MPGISSPGKRTTEFGIEVTDSLVWERWEPGREYTKNITLKNIHPKTKKLIYKIPNTKFFITKYPQQVVLSTGKSINLPITFRPIEKVVYEDAITFHTKEGRFLVQMKATLPETIMLLPESVVFGLTAVQDQDEKTFDMHNLSNVKTTFSFQEVEAPFSLSPTSGVLLAKEKLAITAIFKPEGAEVYQFSAVCSYSLNESEQRSSQLITLEGIGKFPHLSLKTAKESGKCVTVDFGKVSVGKEKCQVVELVNMTPVNAPFQMIQSSHGTSVDQAFSSSQYHGVVPRDGSVPIRITFKSSCPNMSFADELKVRAIGTPGNSIINCIGYSVAPDISVKNPYVNFGVALAETTVTRSFQLNNNLGTTSIFQFQIDNDYSAFQLDVISGEVKANSSKTIIVTFVPQKPINYYKRLVCLVHNQGPLYIHLFGTCHSEERKPDVLQRVHLDRYEINVKRGLTRLPPEMIHALKEDGKVIVREDGSLEAVDELLKSDLHHKSIQLTEMETYFNDGTSGERQLNAPHVSTDLRQLDFGRSAHGQVYQKTLNVTNHTKGKVTCQWMSGRKDQVFTVTPEEQDILPFRSASFRVSFTPNATSQFFGAELEAYVYYKCTRDHKIVKEYTFCPPWCLNVGAFGHTFLEKNETFVPKCKWSSSTMIMPPVSQSEASYKTMLLTNTGSNPVYFEFDGELPSVFSCKPAIGLCKDSYKIIVFRMLPSPPGVIKETFIRKVNSSEKYAENISLIGTSEEPVIEIRPKDPLYFKPTCVGTQSTREVSIKNMTRVPLRYHWIVSRKDNKTFVIQKADGCIEPHETQSHLWSFIPSTVDRHFCKVALSVTQANESSGINSRYTVRMLGEGQTGTMSADSSQVNFGNVVVGTSSRKELKLRNDSDCALNYRLVIKQVVRGSYGEEDCSSDSIALELDHTNFALPARAEKTVQLSVYPSRRVEYRCELLYELLGTDNSGSFETVIVEEKRHLCNISVKGVYPSVFVADVRGSGSLLRLSKARLWELFSLERFNTYLDGDPGKEELRYAVATRHSTRRRMPVNTRAVLDFNFNSSPCSSYDSCIRLCLENRSTSDADWAFLFPTDLQLEMEYWSQTGQFDEDELHEMFVMDNQLFTIHPRKGCLRPGESVVVMLSYRNESLGIHKLPVLFKIARGREILLNFIGTTVDPSIHCLHFASHAHTFIPLPIGDITPPIQRYQLYNGGAQTVQFELDLTELEKFQRENCNWRVFECLTPTGKILPGASFDLMWIFSPLEPKMYIVDVPVHILEGESTLLTFTGVGYDPSLLGPTMDFAESADDNLPTSQIIAVPEQLMYLSAERLDFGNFPLFSRNRRTLFLKNTSSKDTISFNWQLYSQNYSQVIKIVPEHGYIQPNNTCMCKVSLYSETIPSIYDLDVICEVVNETEMAKYNMELIKWHERHEEKQHLFTITEKSLKKEKGKTGTNSKTKESKGKQMPDSELKKYNTLPPIGIPEDSMPDFLSNMQSDPLPWPPKTFLVHLGIRGRTFTVDDFNKKFPDNICYHFPKRATSTPESNQAVPNLDVTKEEFGALRVSLEMILRDIIVDKDFKESLKRLNDEPIPYFEMISACMPVSKPATPTDEQMSNSIPGDAFREMPDPSPDEKIQAVKENSTSMGVMSADVQVPMEKSLRTKQSLKRSEELRCTLESVLENTIYNVLTEASCGEISLTSRPRLVGLPPSAKGKRRSVTPLE